jgi:hypothetical protein
MSSGLDLSNLDGITQEEKDAWVASRWRTRGPLYDLYATTLMLDYNPKFAKLHRWGADILRVFETQPEKDHFDNTLPYSFQQLHSYMMLGWEVGIQNEFRVLKRWGLTRSQLMELVHFNRMSAGMRGLGHVYRAIGDFLPDYEDGPGNPPWPAGWAADPAAFKSGLDLTTRALTDGDRTNLAAWYERTIGYLPNSVKWGMKFDPQFVKIHRAMWETAIKTLPKQTAPFIMVRDAMLATDRDALREAVALSKAWGINSEWIVRSITQTAHYFTGMRGLYAAYDVAGDLL